MGNTTVTLNPGSLGATVAFWLDGSSAYHQYVVMETRTGTADPIPVGATNPLPVSFNGTQVVTGDTASGVTDSGTAPLKVAGVFNIIPPSFATGQITDLQTDTNGNLKVNIVAGAAAGGTSSNFGTSFPGSGTAIGFLNAAGTNMQAGQVDASGNLKVNIAAGSVQAITDNNSAFTSGSTQALPSAYAYNDSASALTSGNMGVARVTANRQQRIVHDAATNGGCTPFELIAPATVAVSAVKASPGQLYFVHATNNNSTPVYLKFYNLASGSVTLGTTAATFQFEIPGNTGGAGFTVALPVGLSLSTAISLAVSGGIALTDNTAITASSVNVALGYA
jgi:hypothetical protein